MDCQVDTCCESTDDGQPRKATTWVAQGTTPDDLRLRAVCDMHCDGWYDGCDDFLPRVEVPVREG